MLCGKTITLSYGMPVSVRNSLHPRQGLLHRVNLERQGLAAIVGELFVIVIVTVNRRSRIARGGF